MITREDLKTVEIQMDMDTTEWRSVVAPDGRKFILSATNVTEEDLDSMNPFIAITFLLAPEYMIESAVYPADDNWSIPGECGTECAKGVCIRRISEDRTTGNIDRAYQLLLNYLNG